MALVGTFVEPIEKFNAYSVRANKIFFDEFYPSGANNDSLQNVIDQDTQYIDNRNSLLDGLSESPIVGNDFYNWGGRLLIFGYTPIELFEMFFQIKSVKVSWTSDFSLTDNEQESYNGELLYPNMQIESDDWSNQVRYYTIKSPSYGFEPVDVDWIVPVERCCDGKLGNLYSDFPSDYFGSFDNPAGYSKNWRTSLSFNNFFDHYNVYDFRDEGKGLAINVMPKFVALITARYSGGNIGTTASAQIGESATTAIWTPTTTTDDFAFKKIPFTFIDGQKHVTGETYLLSQHWDGVSLVSMDAELTIEIERFEFET